MRKVGLCVTYYVSSEGWLWKSHFPRRKQTRPGTSIVIQCTDIKCGPAHFSAGPQKCGPALSIQILCFTCKIIHIMNLLQLKQISWVVTLVCSTRSGEGTRNTWGFTEGTRGRISSYISGFSRAFFTGGETLTGSGSLLVSSTQVASSMATLTSTEDKLM